MVAYHDIRNSISCALYAHTTDSTDFKGRQLNAEFLFETGLFALKEADYRRLLSSLLPSPLHLSLNPIKNL
jgi:hypothetical protein